MMKTMHYVLVLLLLVIQHVYVYGNCSTDDVQDLPDIAIRAPDVAVDEHHIVSDYTITDNKWYRVVYNGWQYLMVDSTNKPNYADCSTYYPIYLQGIHPPVDNLTTEEVDAVACTRDLVNACDLSYKIKIRKCSDGIQYYLPQTKIYSAYCFSNHSMHKDTLAAPPTDVQLGNVRIQPKINFMSTVITNTITEYDPYFTICCNFTLQDYYYNVNWYIDGQLIISLGPSNDTDNLVFHEDVLRNNGLTLGFDIVCGVSVQSSEDGAQTDMIYSASYFAGIQILTSPLHIDKGGNNVSLQMKATIPIGCQYFTGFGPPPEASCTTDEFRVWNEGSDECTFQGAVASTKCASTLKTLSFNDIWEPEYVYSFTIVTTDMDYDDKRVFNLRLEFNHFMGHRIWRNYKFPNVQVLVNAREYQRKICYSHIDPHLSTADGIYYQQQKIGDYLLYNNTAYGIEVQEKTTSCYGAICTCGVAIRAGKDVFMINRCGGINYLGFTECGDGGILQVVKVNDHQYNVFTPIGTRITITLQDWIPQTMNVDIIMAPKDMHNTAGLCGYFDNDETNDLRHRNGSTTTSNEHEHFYYSFSDTWRLSDEENLFIHGSRKLDSWEQHNGLYCVCNGRGAEALCSPTQYLNCTMDKSITGTNCRVTNRSKRNTISSQDKEMKRLFSLMVPHDSHVIRKREDESNYITKEQAEAFCTQQINNSLAVTSYGELSGNEDPNAVISQCIFDVEVSNDFSLADLHVEAMNTIVKNMIELEPIYVANNTEKVETFLLNTCPGNCSDNGNCTKTGVCACYGYYHGPACTIDERDALYIDDIEGGGECDLADGDECICFHVLSNNILEGIQCTSRSAKISTSNTVEVVSTLSYYGGYEDIFTGVCCMPENIVGTDGVYVTKYDVSISNDGVTYSNEKSVYVFDSTCQEIDVQKDGSRLVTLKAETCFIDDHCVVENEMSLNGCEACQSSIAVYSWSEYNPCQHGGSCTDAEYGYSCTCLDGYKGMTCESEIDECASNPCLNGGGCTDIFLAYNCTCAAGFAGTNCETNIDECASQPCQHESTCMDGIAMYTCTCANGYAGIHCETDINECTSHPCQNGGVCSDEVNRYTCTCANGYGDIHCGTDMDECSSNPCQHEGSCTDSVNGYTCTCAVGYFGVVCETDVDDCAENRCQNGGTCNDAANGRTCTCLPGYIGTNCETDTNECAPIPCANGGSCTDIVNGYTCRCRSGYEGPSCETNIDECASSPCLNNGVCGDLVDGYTCSCLAGYGGTRCESDIDECASTPCQNDGTCIDSINGYTCTCQSGYEGNHCGTNTDDCVPNPCMNGGKCEDLINEYECACVAGYDGTDCETNINECSSNPCQNGGSCEDLVNKYACSCMAGYEGTICERNTDDCATFPCLNGGRCEDLVNGYVCACRAGYEDNNCGTVVTTLPKPTQATTPPISIVFPFESSAIELNDPIIIQDIQYELSTYFQTFMRDPFKAIHILDIRYGSLVVVFEVDYDDTPTAVSDLTTAITSLVNGHYTVTLLNETVAATTLQIQEQTFTKESLDSSSGQCEVFLIINGHCEDNHLCTLVEDSPACVMKDTSLGLATVIIIVACSFSLLTMVCIVSCLVIRCLKMRQKRALHPYAKHSVSSGSTGHSNEEIGLEICGN